MFGPEDEEIEDTQDDIEEVEDAEEADTEIEIPDSVKIVQAALNGDAVSVTDAFKNAMSNRIADVVQARKEYIAQTLIVPDEEQPEVETETDHEETETDNSDSVSDGDASEQNG